MSRSFVVVNKKQVIAAVTALAVFIALSAFAANLDLSKAETVSGSAEESTLVIDAGHGGIDGGQRRVGVKRGRFKGKRHKPCHRAETSGRICILRKKRCNDTHG